MTLPPLFPNNPTSSTFQRKRDAILNTLSRHGWRTAIAAGMVLAFGLGVVFQDVLKAPLTMILAEQVGDSPESSEDSLIKEAVDHLTGLGYGSDPIDEWTEDWGAMWNRIMRAASWVPDGDATASDVWIGKTFHSEDSRGQQVGTLNPYGGFKNHRLDTSTESFGSWTQTFSGGTPASVTVNGSTASLISNLVMRDERTRLYWSDASSTSLQNRFTWVTGDDSDNPIGNSCNLTSPGIANTWCNVSDYSESSGGGWTGWANPYGLGAPDSSKVGVSSAEFCLNLSLDDGSGIKTDWRLPNQREMQLALLNGAKANLPNPALNLLGSTQAAGQPYNSAFMNFNSEVHNVTANKWSTSYRARCVRDDY